MSDGIPVTPEETAALILVATVERTLHCSFGGQVKLLDVPGNEWAVEELAKMRQRQEGT